MPAFPASLILNNTQKTRVEFLRFSMFFHLFIINIHIFHSYELLNETAVPFSIFLHSFFPTFAALPKEFIPGVPTLVTN